MFTTIDNFIQGTWHKKAYSIMLYASYILFGIAFTGILAINPTYLSTLDTILKYYVSIFLLFRFNPWARKAIDSEARDFDRQIAFAAGFFLLLTTAAADLAHKYVTEIAKQATTLTGFDHLLLHSST